MLNSMETMTVQLDATPRRFGAAFPLESVGFIENHPYASVAVRGKLELCIRLGSSAEFARDLLDGEEYVTRYPNVILKMPEVLHTFTVDRPRDAVYFRYRPELADAMRAAGLFAPPFCRGITVTQELNRILREARSLLPHSQEEGVADRLDLLALQAFEECMLQHGPLPEDDPAGAKLRRIASYFQLNFQHGIDLDELLEANGLSRRSFFRAWKRAFRLSPAAYLQELRLAEAKRLLEETILPVWKISQRLGYRNSNYFTLFFRRRTGATPLAWRGNSKREGER